MKNSNPMSGKSLQMLMIEKYGEIDGNKKFLESRAKMSSTAKDRLSKLSKSENADRMNKSAKLNNNHLLPFYENWVKKFGKVLADEKLARYRKTKSKNSTGRKKKNEEIAKIRVSKIKRVEEKIKATVSPRYNPTACKIIDEFGYPLGYNFQHAENGGEVHVKGIGCFLDGYDKEKNTVVEFYERFHYLSNGELKDKDKRREGLIINNLLCSFIRINAFDKNNIKIEKVA